MSSTIFPFLGICSVLCKANVNIYFVVTMSIIYNNNSGCLESKHDGNCIASERVLCEGKFFFHRLFVLYLICHVAFLLFVYYFDF